MRSYLLLGVLAVLLLALGLNVLGFQLVTYNVPFTCAGHSCQAIGASIFLPTWDRIDLQLSGPGPGVYWAPAGSPSNFVAR